MTYLQGLSRAAGTGDKALHCCAGESRPHPRRGTFPAVRRRQPHGRHGACRCRRIKCLLLPDSDPVSCAAARSELMQLIWRTDGGKTSRRAIWEQWRGCKSRDMQVEAGQACWHHDDSIGSAVPAGHLHDGPPIGGRQLGGGVHDEGPHAPGVARQQRQHPQEARHPRRCCTAESVSTRNHMMRLHTVRLLMLCLTIDAAKALVSGADRLAGSTLKQLWLESPPASHTSVMSRSAKDIHTTLTGEMWGFLTVDVALILERGIRWGAAGRPTNLPHPRRHPAHP